MWRFICETVEGILEKKGPSIFSFYPTVLSEVFDFRVSQTWGDQFSKGSIEIEEITCTYL